MPELPEVETTVRELRKHVVGLKITGLWTDWPKMIKRPRTVARLVSRIRNKTINDVQRRAKYIVVRCDGGEDLYIHQKMSGHLLYGFWTQQGTTWISAEEGLLRDDPKNRHIRMVMTLSNGYHLALADQRRFGTLTLATPSEAKTIPHLSKLGPEPLEISPAAFIKLFHTKRGKIKHVLMDPAFIAGIGNIYADEILWDSAVHPLTDVQRCNPADLTRIYRSMRTILKKAIRYQGSSMDDYRLPSGEKGRFQDLRKAYHRHGMQCARNDGGTIEQIRTNQRSAHFCPKHQIQA